jgi:HK97 family phage prohead protease
MDTIYKTFRAEVKGVNVETGEVDMFIPVSSMSVDRDGEVVEPLAFKKTLPKFMKRPVLVASHDYKDLTNQIGEWSRLKIGDTGMDGKPKYYINEGNAQADWGFKLASKGMAAFSIGFIPTKWEDGETEKEPRRTYKEVELLEISQVIVPSNREAIQSIRSKSVDPIVNALIDDIVNAEIVDLTEEKPSITDDTAKVEHKEKPVSQAEIKDEIDYLHEMINEAGMASDTIPKALALTTQILDTLRITGSDIPEDIKEHIFSILGPTAEEKEKGKLAAIKDMVEQKIAVDTEKSAAEKKRLDMIHNIVRQMLIEEVKAEKKTQVDTIQKLIKRKLTEV